VIYPLLLVRDRRLLYPHLIGRGDKMAWRHGAFKRTSSWARRQSSTAGQDFVYLTWKKSMGRRTSRPFRAREWPEATGKAGVPMKSQRKADRPPPLGCGPVATTSPKFSRGGGKSLMRGAFKQARARQNNQLPGCSFHRAARRGWANRFLRKLPRMNPRRWHGALGKRSAVGGKIISRGPRPLCQWRLGPRPGRELIRARFHGTVSSVRRKRPRSGTAAPTDSRRREGDGVTRCWV